MHTGCVGINCSLCNKSKGNIYVVDKFIKPYNVPAIFLPVFCTALGWCTDPRTYLLANMTVQCAEDNALAELKKIRRNRTVTEIKWLSVTATEKEIKHKPLCPFCQAAFKPRAMDVNNWQMPVTGETDDS